MALSLVLIFCLFRLSIRSFHCNMEYSVDTSIPSPTDWDHFAVDMVSKIERKSNYFLLKRKIFLSDPFPQCKLKTTKIRNSSGLFGKKVPTLSSPMAMPYHPRSNDFLPSIYAVTIIIFCATWIFKKER